ncbi:hypothetical protein [Paraferrimonas haliotis]|uniref:hypothetical protein n=1 Tax=Paraferrimonas haliotis TaxID=2013866 RepID=UPI000BA90243|nr:hypothetical protein [Paraferrimonas haliotis]
MKQAKPYLVQALAAAIALTGTATIAAEGNKDQLNFNGSVRVNYGLALFDEASKEKGGDLKFDTATFGVDGKHGDWGLSAEYRVKADSHFIKFGYASYQFDPEWEVHFGIHHVPFGNRDYISHSWFYGVPYYLGFEDNYDNGIKFIRNEGNWHTDLAFYKNAEYGPTETKGFAPNLFTGEINGTQYNNEQTNQFNLRQTYTYDHNGGSTTLGGSAMWGQILNNDTNNSGDRYAIALHANTNYFGWGLQLQAMQYEFDAADAADANKIGMAVMGGTYEVASKGQIYQANLSKTFKTDFGSVQCYNDFGVLTPNVSDSNYDNSYQNVTGCTVSAGPTFSMIDFVLGKNMVWATEFDEHVGLPAIGSGWDKTINLNFGYYF